MQNDSKGSVVIMIEGFGYLYKCLNCNSQINSTTGSTNYCPTCGKDLRPLSMATGEIIIHKEK